MNTKEFQAWFQGFVENIPGRPNDDQWERIKARVSEIDGTETTKTVFVEKYRDHYPMKWLGGSPTYGWDNSFGLGHNVVGIGGSGQGFLQNHVAAENSQFSSLSAYKALGKTEYQEIAKCSAGVVA